jgi:hypothetical protein
MTEIEVALVGRNERLRLGPSEHVTAGWWDAFLEGESDRAWNDRPRVPLSVADDEKLGSIFDRAIAALGAFDADWSEWRYDGRDPGRRTARLIALRADDSPLPLLERMSNDITVLDDHGLGLFSVSHHEVTYAQLQRSSSAGALYGDPRQIYLYIRWEPAGGGVAHGWEFLVEAWGAADAIARTIGIGAAAYKIAQAVRRRLAGREVIDANARDWVRRRGGVDYVARTLRGDPWRPRDFAGVHGITTQEAEDVLSLFGYDPRPDSDLWFFRAGDPTLGLDGEDVSAEVVVRYTREVLWREGGPDTVSGAELEALVRVMLERASTDGDLSDFGYRGDSRLWPGVWGEGRNWFD